MFRGEFLRKGVADMSYIKDISHDEVRSGFLVTTDRKNVGKIIGNLTCF